MRKGFTRKPQADEPATRGKNYITRSGLQRLKDEHQFLLTRDRPAVTEVVAWAASNGDRSENADYQYGKRRLRQIDGRLRFLTKRIKAAEVVDEGILRGDRALCQCRGSGASGEHRRHRRGRSQPQPHRTSADPVKPAFGPGDSRCRNPEEFRTMRLRACNHFINTRGYLSKSFHRYSNRSSKDHVPAPAMSMEIKPKSMA
jgi:hypothetical protein